MKTYTIHLRCRYVYCTYLVLLCEFNRVTQQASLYTTWKDSLCKFLPHSTVCNAKIHMSHPCYHNTCSSDSEHAKIILGFPKHSINFLTLVLYRAHMISRSSTSYCEKDFIYDLPKLANRDVGDYRSRPSQRTDNNWPTSLQPLGLLFGSSL